MQLELVDHAGVGKLSARNATQLLAEWRFTLGHNLQAASLLSRFNKLQAGHSPASWQVWCPTCHAPLNRPRPSLQSAVKPKKMTHRLPPGACSGLWRFAKPYQGQLLLGFVLTLLSTAATLVPPYLTMPLMDEVLDSFSKWSAN